MLTNRAALEAHIQKTPITGTPTEMRIAFEALAGRSQPYEVRAIGGVPCGVFGGGSPILWLHGGGYVFGSSQSHANLARYLSRLSGYQVIVPDYRRAPEHKWPAQLHDAAAVFRALGPATPVIGESAGGHLALNLALLRGINPRAVALISPNTDRTGKNMMRATNSATDLMNDDADDAALARQAFGGLPPDHPQVSPILVDLAGLPPLYLTAAQNEVLFGDAVILNDLAQAAGVQVRFDVMEDIFHMWPLWPLATTQAQETLHRIAAFLHDTAHQSAERKVTLSR